MAIVHVQIVSNEGQCDCGGVMDGHWSGCNVEGGETTYEKELDTSNRPEAAELWTLIKNLDGTMTINSTDVE